jgi:hypothetical protein
VPGTVGVATDIHFFSDWTASETAPIGVSITVHFAVFAAGLAVATCRLPRVDVDKNCGHFSGQCWCHVFRSTCRCVEIAVKPSSGTYI